MIPRPPLLFAAGLLAVAGLRALAGCVATPQGLRFTPEGAVLADAAFAAACPIEAAIPTAGPVLVALCPEEDAAAAAGVGTLTAPAALPTTVGLYRLAKPSDAPAKVRQMGPLQVVPYAHAKPGPAAVDLQVQFLAAKPPPALTLDAGVR